MDSFTELRSPQAPTQTLERWRVDVRGVVQGVGFRPFVHALASELGLSGSVGNTPAGVVIEIQGQATSLQVFCQRLTHDVPRLARIDKLTHATLPCRIDEQGFSILASLQHGKTTTIVAPDSAICDDCLRELFAPTDRRYRYPFINCTHCGPRYTLTYHVPYDRATTSMAVFPQCPVCQAEYSNPHDRRFHAEPNACPTCGPQLRFCTTDGQPTHDEPVSATVRALNKGQIIAIKGLGGFHLACNAHDAAAVAELRRRKARDEKPLAVMALNVRSAERWCHLNRDEQRLLTSLARPIVTLARKDTADATMPGLAPEMNTLGVMLPYTPLHYVLFHEALGSPVGTEWLEKPCNVLWVMTSANPGGEPLVIDNDEAVQRLSGIADGYLMHNRDIVGRCDDSVLRVTPGAKTVYIRRARGEAPRAIPLSIPEDTPSVLATGAYFKNTICVTRGKEAFLSPHIGSLDNAATCRAHDEMIERLLDLLQVRPALLAHDHHPDFYSSLSASRLAQQFNVSALAVRHHHAHIAAVAAEHGLKVPVLGLAFDGVGLGDDGTAWGGEWLRVEGTRCERLGHLSPLLLAGGDKAAREPWRVACAALLAHNDAEALLRSHFSDQPQCPATLALLRRALHQPTPHVLSTTSMGRYFDAAAAALKLCPTMSFEGQAAMQLESLAHRYLTHHSQLPVADALICHDAQAPDLKPLVAALFEIHDPEYGAALFHGTLIAAVVAFTEQLLHRHSLQHLVGAGGCWINTLLAHGLQQKFHQRGFTLHLAHQIPPNDGGLALGQAWLAALTLTQDI